MGFLQSLFNLVSSVFKQVFAVVSDLFHVLLPILIIVAAIYFAPEITLWLSEAGAPSFMVEAFSSLSALTPEVVGAVSWLSTTTAAFGTTLWGSFKTLELGTQLMMVAGASALIAPEAAADLVTSAGDAFNTVAVAVGDVVGSVASTLLGTPILIAGGVLLLLFLSKRDKNG